MLGIGLLLGGAVLVLVGLYFVSRKRFHEDLPTSRIRSLAMGLVEISGEAVPAHGTLTSPLQQRPCLWYRYLVQRHERHYNTSQKRWEDRWVTEKDEKKWVSFSLKDETGSVLVDPTGASVSLSCDHTRQEGNRRHQEWLIAPADRLYIIGTAADNPAVGEGTAVRGVDDVIVRKGTEEKRFLITDKTEAELVRGYLYYSVATFIGGAALLAAGIMVLVWMGW